MNSVTVGRKRAGSPISRRRAASPTKRWLALSKAEARQFVRNRLLMFLALVFPVGLPVGMFFALKATSSEIFATASVTEMFILFAMLFIQFYAALSMATTRRDEKVLTRLRTGELRDSEILYSIATPRQHSPPYSPLYSQLFSQH